MSDGHNQRVCLNLAVRQAEDIRDYADQAGLSQSELVRRLFDRFLTAEGMNLLVPQMSGAFRVRG